MDNVSILLERLDLEHKLFTLPDHDEKHGQGFCRVTPEQNKEEKKKTKTTIFFLQGLSQKHVTGKAKIKSCYWLINSTVEEKIFYHY